MSLDEAQKALQKAVESKEPYSVTFAEDAMRYCVHRRDLTYVAKEAIAVKEDVVDDPTLPRFDRDIDPKVEPCKHLVKGEDGELRECGNGVFVFFRVNELVISDAVAIIFV